MKIEKAEAFWVKMPLKFPFETSYGRETHVETVLVRLEGEGLVGWGEAAVSSFPDYCYETPSVALLALQKYFMPLVVGQDFEDPAALLAACSHVCGYPFTRTGVESAFVDLYCRSQETSIRDWLGGTRSCIEAGVSLGIELDQGLLFERINWALDEGYKRIKLKIKPGKDVSMIAAVRENFDYFPLMVDANSSYRLEDWDRLVALDKFHLMMIEQPLSSDDLADHAYLQERMRTHVCLDESIKGMSDLKVAAALGSCRIVNVKYGRVGGLIAARALAKECLVNGIAVWCGGMLETGIGRAHNIALNSLPEFSLPGDVSASDRYWEEDLIDPPVTMDDGLIELPDGPGIGFNVIEERVERATLEKLEFK